MPQEKLTAEFVETATSNGKPREFYWDETLPGFGLMVTDTGSSSFVIQYRNAYGVSRRLKINGGKTLAQAKREAKAKLGEVAKGGDPMADKRQQRDASKDTLRKVVEDQYLVDAEIK
ncbi:MAG: Arm DNA-binding domain-containing protein, partial [Pseudolabrys sp.]